MPCGAQRNISTFCSYEGGSTEADLFRCFWSCGRGWGVYTQRRDGAGGDWKPEVLVLGGDMCGVRVTACGQAWAL